MFEPIAIVGRSCVLPGAHDPEALWSAVVAGDDLVSSAPAGRWGLSPEHALTADPSHSADRAWSDRGGYVRGFDFESVAVSDPFARDAEDLLALDPLFHWVLHTGRQALRQAGHRGRSDRVGAVMGNLQFPSSAMSRFAEHVWLGAALQRPPVDPRNRFMSGLPALLMADELGLDGGAFALDAACASSLYALKLACDRLHDRTTDLMLAGAVNRSDDLFIHVGFCALNAMSRSGRSRPFHREADGLLPAEGAAFLALKRLSDAVTAGDRVFGVIRGVGLSNDGRGRGLLAPASAGQQRALQHAWAGMDVDRSRLSLLEAHATGTTVGDAAEIETLQAFFGEHVESLPVGSLKSNLGHGITVAGAAGILKVLGAMEHGVLPPTLHVDDPTPALDGTCLRLLSEARPWASDGPRLAAVDAFGFGGNNAHVVIEEFTGPVPMSAAAPAHEPAELAVVALSLRTGAGGTRESAEALFAAAPPRAAAAMDEVVLPLMGLRFPPNDLQQTLAQQLVLLDAALEATAGLRLPRERTSILVGSQSDPEVCRYGARWRLSEWLADSDAATVLRAQDATIEVLQSAGVVGNMPNIPANRLNSQFDVAGPGFTVAAEQASGLVALQIGARMLRAREVDTAVIAAVDMCAEAVHAAAARAVVGDQVPADAAVVLVVRRLADAQRDGDPVLAVIDDSASGELALGNDGLTLESRFGHAHAAMGLLHLAAGVLACRHGRRPDPRDAAEDWSADRSAAVNLTPLGSTRSVRWAVRSIDVEAHPLAAPIPPPEPSLRLPAHPAPVAVDVGESAPENVMEPAPPLPPTTDASVALTGATGFAPADAEGVMEVAPSLRPVTGSAPAHHSGVVTPAAAAPAAAAPPPPRALPARPRPRPVTAARVMAHGSAEPQVGTLAGVMPVVPGGGGTPTAWMAAPHDPTALAASYLSEVHQQLSRVHQDFVVQQQAVHERFLALRQQAMRALTEGRTVIDAAPVVDLGSVPRAPASVAVSSLAPRTIDRVAAAPSAPPPAAPPAVAPAPKHRVPEPPAAPATSKPLRAAPPSTATDRVPRPTAESLPGPSFDRQQLEVLASDKISKVFGPQFAIQDDFPRQVRMPEPPLLLADRVLGIDAEPGSMTTGTIWTETDVVADGWYVHQAHMPAGVMIEAGQADLLLISWLGADFQNRGKRVYRLLGCQLTYSGGLPTVGDTLTYDIHVDGHANHGDTRIFFFHYDCRVEGAQRLSVREGQAGFFSEAELAESGGILWTPETGDHDATARVDPPVVASVGDRFSPEQVLAFARGDGAACFGEGYELLKTHVRSPRIPERPLLFWDEVSDLDTCGGPWKRGYLRAVQAIRPDDWFFDGHFKDDPCMPGTMMFEACLHALSFYMAALGLTLRTDGWRFEPVPDIPYDLKCRGQVTPTSRELIYEVFIEEVHGGARPVVYADFLCTVDGLKAFHARRVGVQLVPDWPLTDRPHLLADHVDAGPVAVVDGFPFGYASLLACAWGRPSEAFGPMYAPFDEGRHCARLPGPPYHFMTRLSRIDGAIGGMEVGTEIDLAYDVPPDAWYFDENGCRSMPFAVLLEAALQPCGWIACYIGSALTTDQDLYFRNLDGTATWHREVLEGDGTLRTIAKITNISLAGGMIIESFEVRCFLGDDLVYEMDTVFGFFPREALANQIGITPSAEERAVRDAPSDFSMDLTEQPERYFSGPARLAGTMLCMIDRITGYWPSGGKAGLGKLRSEKTVDQAEWFFKAHFFTDPVQPGSLGLEAMVQVLQFFMLHTDMDAGMDAPRFEPLMLGRALTWKYRGQVVPTNRVIRVELDVVEVGDDDAGRFAIADAWLWVDDLRIFQATQMGMRLVDDGDLPRGMRLETDPTPGEEVLDLGTEPWLADHRPTWTMPALPAMSMVDRLAGAAVRSEGVDADALRAVVDVSVHGWVQIDGPTRLRTDVRGRSEGPEGIAVQVAVQAWRDRRNSALSRFEDAAVGTVWLGGDRREPTQVPVLEGPELEPDPYASGALFHGPAFQCLTALSVGTNGSTATLSVSRCQVPHGTLGQGLLDAVLHAVPHDSLHRWCAEIGEGWAAYPLRVDRLDMLGPRPADMVRVEVRWRGLNRAAAGPDTADVAVWAFDGASDRPWLELSMVEVLLPKGPIGSAPLPDRLAFLRDRVPVEGLGLSTHEGGATTANGSSITASDWLPGTVRSLYASTGDLQVDVAVGDHVAALGGVHPSTVSHDGAVAISSALPLSRFPIAVDTSARSTVVRSTGPTENHLDAVRAHWDRWFSVGRWPVEDFFYGLIQRFVRRVVRVDPAAHEALRGQSVLYLGNHQVAVESLLFSIIASGLSGVNTVTVAKAEHRHTWLGRLIAHSFSWPQVNDPEVITFFDRADKASLPAIIGDLGAQMEGPGKSVMVHVEGTRSKSCTRPVERMSSAFLDLAVRIGAPVVPVRFVGGLPTAPLDERIEFPLNMGQQDIWLGAPLRPEELQTLPYKERKLRVIAAINGTGPDNADERPLPGDSDFARRVERWQARAGVGHEHAAVFEVLRDVRQPTELTQRLVAAAESGTLDAPEGPIGDWLTKLAGDLIGKRLS